jgi:pyruvate kinase
MRKTKIVCTIGPKTCDYKSLVNLAEAGMNVVRLNMSHGDHDWHKDVIKAVKRINEKTDFSLAIMLDTKGPEVRTGDLQKERKITKGQQFIFTTKLEKTYPIDKIDINYDSFDEDVQIGDKILIDGGILSFRVKEIKDGDVITECIDGGTLTSRRHVNIRGKSANLPAITDKDWDDIKFGLDNNVDFIALSFVKTRNEVDELREYVDDKKYPVEIISKVESAKAIDNLEDIVDASDGIMVARGDLGAELPVEEVPVIQERLIKLSRNGGKPVIVATQLLESMISNPTPTRAEVSDIATAVSEKSDAIMLSGETAMGDYPDKCVMIMDTVSQRIEDAFDDTIEYVSSKKTKSDYEIVRSATIMANNLDAKALLVFTRSGYMASLLAKHRPNSNIFAFTNTSHVRRRLNLYWGVNPVRIDFSSTPEKTIQRAIDYLTENKYVKNKDSIVLVSDILVKDKFVQTVQIREV